MTPLLSLVVYMAIVTWATLLAASVIRAEGWTAPGMMLMTGNRDNLPTPSPLAGRADRAARNTQENFMLFVALAIVACRRRGPVAESSARRGSVLLVAPSLPPRLLCRSTRPAHSDLGREHRRLGHDDHGDDACTVIIGPL